MGGDDAGPIFLYDGVCALCNWMVRFVLARDRAGVFRFASLQSVMARAVLTRHGRDPADLATVVVVVDPGRGSERLLDRSSAVLFVLQRLTRAWRAVGAMLKVVPPPLRDLGYRAIAASRYRTFGRYDACTLPPPEHRRRFLD